MKRAILYDWIDSFGGAERLLPIVFDMYPNADIYTLFVDYNKALWARPYKHRIRTTWLQELYDKGLGKKALAVLMPLAVQTMHVSDYDKVLTITSSFLASAPVCASKHVLYCFSPPRYIWDSSGIYISRWNILGKAVQQALKIWMRKRLDRDTQVYTISRFSQKRIQKAYGLDSNIIYPPFDIKYFNSFFKGVHKPNKLFPKHFFLFVGRLEPYKRVDIIVDAFLRMSKKNIVIVGRGTQLRVLKKRAKARKNIIFYNSLSDKELSWLYAHAQALIMPQSEDFGYTAVEALFFGTKVVSYKESAVADIARIFKKGCIFFKHQTYDSLIHALDTLHTISYNKNISLFKKFDKVRFVRQLRKVF